MPIRPKKTGQRNEEWKATTYGEFFTGTRQPIIQEMKPPEGVTIPKGARYYQMGEAIIICNNHPEHGWNMTIARKDHYPSWDEVARAWYDLTTRGTQGKLMLPLPSTYINTDGYIMQVLEDKHT